MRLLAGVLIALMLGALPAAAAPPTRSTDFSQPEQILRWINTYRLKPEPERLPEAVKAMSALGVLRELDSAGVYVGFTAGVLGANPAKAEKLVTAMFPMRPEDQVLIVRAIAYSDLPDWKGLLGKFIERMPARKVLIDRHLFGKAQTLMELPLDSGPAALDALWGYYFATGSAKPIRRIVTALPWSMDRNDVDKLTTGSMVKLTLAVNATRDQELLSILQDEVRRQPKEVVIPLRQVIEAAETYETAKIRKEALASIDEIKRKGSADLRNWNWWGQAGTTALALGCVGAAALGQVQFGLPCVVGGALSTAAVKYLGPQQ
jgi:hypothetical protein